MNYDNLEMRGKNGVKCMVCNHYCELSEQQTGICGVRKNENGKIKSTVYGKVAAVSVGSIERNQFYHVLPSGFAYLAAPDGCNLTCPFCGTYESRKETGGHEKVDMMPKDIVRDAIEYGCNAIAYGYSEPTVYIEFVLDVAYEAKRNGLKNLLSTNGFMSDIVIDSMTGLIDAVNLDIKCFSESKYREILNADLDVVRGNLEHLIKNGIWVEITTPIVSDFNDSINELSATAKSIAEIDKNIPWHLKRFFPAHKYKSSYPSSYSIIHEAYLAGKEAGLNYIYSTCNEEAKNTVCPACASKLIVRCNQQVVKNNLTEGRCPKCKQEIPGLW